MRKEEIKSMSELMQPAQTYLDNVFKGIQFNLAISSKPLHSGPRNERDELFDFFYEKLAEPWQEWAKKPLRKAYLASRIAHLKVPDLYYLKSTCLDAERRGEAFSKVFWGSLKIK